MGHGPTAKRRTYTWLPLGVRALELVQLSTNGPPNCRRRNGGYKTNKAVTKPKRSLQDWITVTKPTYVYLDSLSGYLASAFP